MRNRIARAAFQSVLITLIIALIVGGAAFIVTVADDDTASLSYRSIDYEATATKDGDLKITQRLDYKLQSRDDEDGNTKPWKQLYWRYALDPSNLIDITDIRVRNADTGQAFTQTEFRNPNQVGDTSWDSDYANRWYIVDVTGGDSNPQPYEPGSNLAPNTQPGKRIIEIGWNIPATDNAKSLKIDVSFTMRGVATKYDDVTTFQWEPIAKENEVPAGKVTGLVRFPEGTGSSGAPDASDPTVPHTWLHTANTNEVTRESDGTMHFTVSDLKVGGYINVIGAFDSARAGDVARTAAGGRLQSLNDEEDAKARYAADRKRDSARVTVMIWAAGVVLAVILGIWGVLGALYTLRAARYKGNIEYWRDMPGISPDSAARLVDVFDAAGSNIRHSGKLDDRSLSATVMSLAVKKAIALYPGPSDLYRDLDMAHADPAAIAQRIGQQTRRVRAAQSTTTVVILPVALAVPYDSRRKTLELSRSESACLDLLVDISRRVGGPVFDFVQMKHACEDWKTGYQSLERFRTTVRDEFALLGATRSISGYYVLPAVLETMLGVACFIFNLAVAGNAVAALCFGLPPFAIGLFCALAGVKDVPTPAGQEYGGRCLGLRRYMVDFSDFTDRGVPDLALWDWYMVYAAAFGISREAIAQLAKAYPQVRDSEWLDEHASDSLWYWTYRPYLWNAGYSGSDRSGGGSTGDFAFGGDSFASGLSDLGTQISAGVADISSTISAAAPSSSYGSSSFGGGFDGGGGGSGGGTSGGR